MNDIYAFLTTQTILFLAPAGFAWFIALCFRCRPAIRRNILIGATLGFCSSWLVFAVFWPIIFPIRETPVPIDGQNGLGEGLIIIALIGLSYLISGLFFVIRTAFHASKPPPLPSTK